MTEKKNIPEAPNIIGEPSVLGESWVPLFQTDIGFKNEHYEAAMQNLIKQPNINSTVILRADILKENKYDYSNEESNVQSFESEMAHTRPDIPTTSDDEVILEKNLEDIDLKTVPLEPQWRPAVEIVRRIIPRNPFKDYIINQTCLVLSLKEDDQDNEYKSTLVVYSPHITTIDDCPFYLPDVQAVGILLRKGALSLHYLPFNYQDKQTIEDFKTLDHGNRNIRIAFRLLQTAKKHSTGVMDGYQKRVNHDQVVSKVSFQDRYIALKKKYTKHFVDNWVESTDPRKHVFEDIAIAAFLIELWSKVYKDKNEFEFRDLGCGNGLLVNILISEGYRGIGIDARARKSWKIYSEDVRSRLKEQVIIPSILLRPHPAVKSIAPQMSDNGRVFQVPINNGGEVPVVAYYSSATLLRSTNVNTAQFPKNTFIIGNHSDELTCWIPLLGYPFLVIPCCSHALNGARVRYPSRRRANNTLSGASSTYAALVDHAEDLAKEVGWKVEREMLRIPSTRNAAIIGYQKDPHFTTPKTVYDILALEGGAEGWVENTMALTKRPPRKH
jgi:tRNASer (uridine44-2'-O)-methyltransferase